MNTFIPPSSTPADYITKNQLEEHKARLQKACEMRIAADIAPILMACGSLVGQRVTTTTTGDGTTTTTTTMEAYPISYLVMSEYPTPPDEQEVMINEDDEEAAAAAARRDWAFDRATNSIVQVVEAMWPSQLVEGDPQTLPLPLACKNSTLKAGIIQLLIKKYPAAVTIPYRDNDADGGEDGDVVFPIHLYLQRQNPSLETVELFVRAHPKSLADFESGMRCLNICLQNPTCSSGIWSFLLHKYLSIGGPQQQDKKSFVLQKQHGMEERTINAIKLQRLYRLLQLGGVEEFTCHADTIELECFFALCSDLASQLLPNLRNLILIIPETYANDMKNYQKWGLIEIVRNNNSKIETLSIQAKELELDMDSLVEALKVNRTLKSLSFNGRLTNKDAGGGDANNKEEAFKEVLLQHQNTLEKLELVDYKYERTG